MSGPLDSLMPCPFCGQQPGHEPWHGGAPTKVRIDCVGLGFPEGDVQPCEVAPSVTGETPEEAAANWNRRAPTATEVTIANALDVFWNAALGGTHPAQDSTANAVMSGMVEGFAAMANRLREGNR